MVHFHILFLYTSPYTKTLSEIIKKVNKLESMDFVPAT